MSKKGVYVIDSISIISYLEGTKNSKKVSDIFKSALNNEIEIYTTLITYGELLSLIHKHTDSSKVELFKKTFEQLPISVVNVSKELAEDAAYYKAKNNLSFSESYLVALTKSKNACLITAEKLLASLKDIIDVLLV